MTQAEPLMSLLSLSSAPAINGVNGHYRRPPTVEELESELPVVYNDQVPLSEVLSRVVQDIYSELMTLADTLPSSSDSARKRMLADFVVKHKKQVVKLFAVVKWARDAADVQKCMNITAFLMDQNAQFDEAVEGINAAKDSLAPARLRNHDLLTSLDVLSTGSYLRLPTAIKKSIIPEKRLSNSEITRVLASFDHLIRFRLRMSEIIPVEMSTYLVSSAQAHFHVPNLFSVSVSLKGADKDDAWFMVDVEFDFSVGGDNTGVVAFPRSPTGITKRYIAEEANARLGRYSVFPESQIAEQQEQTQVESAPTQNKPETSKPKLPENVVDAPLVRLYNFLQMMSLSYQLEILHYQAQRMRSLGWVDYLQIEFSKDRMNLKASYWIRQRQQRPQTVPQQRSRIPLLGGTVSIFIEPQLGNRPIVLGGAVDSSGSTRQGGRSHKERVLHELGLATKLRSQSNDESQNRSKLKRLPSDEVERLSLVVKWTPETGALGFATSTADMQLEYSISTQELDFAGLLTKIVQHHADTILRVFRRQLLDGPYRSAFTSSDEVAMTMDGETPALHISLCAGEIVVVTIDLRTGRLNLRDTGDLAAAGRGPRFSGAAEKINENPLIIVKAIIILRYNIILESAEQKAISLGLQTYRHRNLLPEELAKFGPKARAHLFIQLRNFPTHYLVLVVTDEAFEYALVSVKIVAENARTSMVMDDIGWLDVARIRGNDVRVQSAQVDDRPQLGNKRKAVAGDPKGASGARNEVGSFRLESEVIRQLYAYCCARVSHTKVEQQLKSRGIPYTNVSPSVSPEVMRDIPRGIHSSLASSVPTLCVQSKDILSGVPAAEAAMPNIRVMPVNWWSDQKCQVVTCVKLKYVQPPVGKAVGTGGTVIRPSKSVIYDTREAIVSFLSEDVNSCVDEFLNEWAKVSTIVVIAREVSQMAKAKKWDDVRLLSFDLQTVEFTYTTGYALSISCTNQLSSGGSYQLRFSRVSPEGRRSTGVSLHDEIGPFLRPLLRNGRLATSLAEMVEMLRDTLPMALELETLTRNSVKVAGIEVDVFSKDCGWYRVLLGDLRHALDFRLMTEKRVVILDGSFSIFATPDKDKDKDSKENLVSDKDLGPVGDLRPLPEFSDILRAVASEIRLEGSRKAGEIALIDVGLVCHVSMAGRIGIAVLKRVAEKVAAQ